MKGNDRPPSRTFCPRCGQKYKVPEEELKARPGLRFRATCGACSTPFSVVWQDGDLQTDVEEILQHETDERDPLRRGTRVGKYEVEDLIDSGGSSSVYKAFEPGANRYVALKLLHRPSDSDFGVRFRREVEVQANLKHPNLMPIFDQGEIDGQPYYTMELLHRPTTLETVVGLFRAGRLGYNPYLRTLNSLEALLRHVVLPVAHAVQFANKSHGIIHRDLKPENVIVDARTLRVYVIDFGICHVLKQTGGRLILRAGAIESGISASKEKPFAMGTLRYMSPEQAAGGVSAQGDVWSLGAIVHFILTGDAPIARALDLRRVNLEKRITNLQKIAASCRESGDDDEAEFYEARAAELQTGEVRTLRDVLRDAQEGTYVPLPDSTDPVLGAIMHHAMRVAPDKRYATAEDFATDLSAWLAGRPVRAYASTLKTGAAAVYSMRLFLKRNRTPVLAAGVVLLLVAIAGAVSLASSTSREDDRIAEWMRNARNASDPSVQKEFASMVLAVRPGHDQARQFLAAARAYAPLLTKVKEARVVRDRMLKLLGEYKAAIGIPNRDPRAVQRRARDMDAIEKQAEETTAVLELGVLPDLALLPKDYPGRQLASEVENLVSVLRGQRVVQIPDFPVGADVLLIHPIFRGGKDLAWDRPQALGTIPLRKTQYSLDPGSYVLIFRQAAAGREILIPLRITRSRPARVALSIPLDPESLPEGMLYVSGKEKMSYGDSRFYDKPARVDVKPFLLDRTEVTNARYAEFVNSMEQREARRHVPRRADGTIRLWSPDGDGRWVFAEGAGDHPVTGVSLSDARAYAEFVGKRLPTPQEWERAARGEDLREYPFGDGLDPTACNVDTGSVAPVGTYPRDRSPYGILDLGGNVAEWTEGGTGSDAIVKGGSFDLSRFHAIAPSFMKRRADQTYPDVGFRCAMSLKDLER